MKELLIPSNFKQQIDKLKCPICGKIKLVHYFNPEIICEYPHYDFYCLNLKCRFALKLQEEHEKGTPRS